MKWQFEPEKGRNWDSGALRPGHPASNRYSVRGGTRYSGNEHVRYLQAFFNMDGTVTIMGHTPTRGHYTVKVAGHPFPDDFNTATIGGKYPNSEIPGVNAWIRHYAGEDRSRRQLRKPINNSNNPLWKRATSQG